MLFLCIVNSQFLFQYYRVEMVVTRVGKVEQKLSNFSSLASEPQKDLGVQQALREMPVVVWRSADIAFSAAHSVSRNQLCSRVGCKL